jgi:stearoyl-CoA desaturase (delta-9 desaturase)
MHHAHADTELDPHSPKYDGDLFSMMWKTKTIYKQIYDHEDKIEEKFKKGVPDWRSFDNWATSWPSILLWSALYTLFYIQFATSWWMFLLLPIHFMMGPVHGVIINWYAHRYGYVNFKVSDTSKNLLPFDFLMMGEGYHNNHHKHGSRANFGGVRWHELDPTYPIIRLLDKTKVIKLV